ncbi:MAG: hypothetical protein HP491_12140 [Nitrospira sp.]|nr:hypothetical protein [Nitrospira sp.]MBH0185811.1 hypothetical protein [Nitrospira sp.]
MGTFALYYHEPRRPRPHELQLIQHATRLAAIAIERERSVQALRRSYEEREKVGQDLHDSVLQSIYAIGLGLDAMKRGLKPATVTRLNGAIAQLNALVHEVRGFITHMPMPTEHVSDLTQAIQSVRKVFVAASGHDIVLRIDPSLATAFSTEQTSQMVLLIKEALSNSVRHARAAHCSVILGRFRGKIRLEIRDDGVGFRVSQRREDGMGLSTMLARAKKLGGRLSIISRPGCGTRVICILPLPSNAG